LEFINFDQITEAQFHHKKIKTQCTVVGRFDPVYSIPKVVTVSYVSDDGQAINEDLTIAQGDEKILEYIDSPLNRQKGLIMKHFNIAGKLEDFEYMEKETQTILRFAISGLIGKERNSNISKPLIVYYIYDKDEKIEDNCSYEFEGYQTSDPKNQATVCVFNKATKLQSDIENFNINSVKDELTTFQSDKNTVDGIFIWLEKLYKYYSENITGIRGKHRFDTHLAVDLTFHSPYRFIFQEKLEKGWMDVMLLGDEGVGKSTIAEGFLNYYELGERISGQNTSFAGLVGGVGEIGGYRIPSWGKFPLNDKRLLFVDEAGDFNTEMWDNMSAMRSSGIVDLVKIIKGKVNARTRVIWTANPKNKGKIRNKYYGIQALPELITKPSDIRRFDLVVIMAKQDDDDLIPNDMFKKKTEEELFKEGWPTPEQDRNLLRWAWSRNENDILFTTEATEVACELSKKLGKEYSDTIPLIIGTDVRIKLARLASALAIRLYSHVPGNPKKVKVTSVHMKCVERIFDMIYGKDESGYKLFSKFEKDKNKTIEDTNWEAVRNILKAYNPKERSMVMNYFMQSNGIRVDDFSMWMSYPKDAAISRLGDFVRLRCLQSSSTSGYYYKTPPFVRFLKIELSKEN
jgi:hypothetical protein